MHIGGWILQPKDDIHSPPLIDGQAGSNTSRGASWLEGDRFLYNFNFSPARDVRISCQECELTE